MKIVCNSIEDLIKKYPKEFSDALNEGIDVMKNNEDFRKNLSCKIVGLLQIFVACGYNDREIEDMILESIEESVKELAEDEEACIRDYKEMVKNREKEGEK